MQRPAAKSLPNRTKKTNRKFRPGHQKPKVDEVIDEGYSSGNPPPATTQDAKFDAPKSTLSKPSNISTGMNSTKKVSKSKTSTGKTAGASEGSKQNGSLEPDPKPPDTEPAVRPRPLHRSESRTFVYIYDEDEKKSKAVTAPDNLNVEVPVLLQYELTEDAIEKCLDQSRFGNKSADVGDSNNNVAEGANGSFSSPTERLLRDRERDETKNKGMHVMKWLINMEQDPEPKPSD